MIPVLSTPVRAIYLNRKLLLLKMANRAVLLLLALACAMIMMEETEANIIPPPDVECGPYEKKICGRSCSGPICPDVCKFRCVCIDGYTKQQDGTCAPTLTQA
ncbi:uncharacterized protein PAF06_016253 [Gastrophryne carolinensis]